MADDPQAMPSVMDWKALPEIKLPVVRKGAGRPPIYTVHKVGYRVSMRSDCEAAGITDATQVNDRCILATAIIEVNRQLLQCRLSPQLAGWAVNLVEATNAGKISLPALIEFGVRKGQVYAEFL